MSQSQPQGRPRGRARGRSRGQPTSAPPQQPASRPGEPAVRGAGRGTGPPPAQQEVVPGRGRMRGGTAQPTPGAGTRPVPVAAPVQPPTAELARMQIQQQGGIGGATTRRRRGAVFDEPSTRPQELASKLGSSGSPVGLIANCFEMSFHDWTLFQFRVEFDPPIDFKRARTGIVSTLREQFTNSKYIFDGEILYALNRFQEERTSFTVQRKTGEMVTVTLLLTNELPPDSPQNLQIYNIFFNRVLKLMKLEQVGRNYYNPRNPPSIPQHCLQVWPGYTTSIARYEDNRILLMADVSFKILHTNTVLQYLYELHERSRNFYDDAKKKLVGEIVMTRYNNKTYRIDDINFGGNPNDEFETRDGKITYMEYYKKMYEKEITDPMQPLLISRPKKKEVGGGERGPICLIPELCFMTGLMEETRTNFQIMKDIAGHTRVNPAKRAETLTKFLREINENTEVQQYLDSWKVKFEPRLVQVKGRVLPPERMFQQQQRFDYRPKEADWSRESRGLKLNCPINLEQWLVIHTNRDSNIAADFISTLKKVAGPVGMRVNDPERRAIRDDRTESYLAPVRDAAANGHQIVVCIVPTNKKDRYDSIKKCCVLQRPIPSQVIVSRTLSKKQMLMSVATKIALQINCKMGGELWGVDIPLNNLMVVGMDTYHDSAVRGRSFLGFVATMNKTLTRYYSRTAHQDPGMEIADSLKTLMTGALKKYTEVNNKPPDRVIVYRDGVGDGQLPVVVEHEVPQILSAFRELKEGGHEIKFGFIVVKKRINNRFFMPGSGGGRGDAGLSNPPPGTVIDNVVTKPQLYDFFLVSQSVRQGTVSPTSYNIIYDKTGLKPDHLQKLTYKLTHLYYNWPGTIRVPAPCLYAHKLAFLIGQSVHETPGPQLADTLFYL